MKCINTKGIALTVEPIVSFLYGLNLEEIQRETVAQIKADVIT